MCTPCKRMCLNRDWLVGETSARCSPSLTDILGSKLASDIASTSLSQTLQGEFTAAYSAQDSDVESVYSVQSKVTAVVKDSTDDLWFLEADDDDAVGYFTDNDDNVYLNEFDVISDVDDVGGSDSDSDFLSKQDDIIIICQSESDLEFFADCEESDIESDGLIDNDLSDADKWICMNCSNANWPLHRFCDFCWSLRPDWLPSRTVSRANSPRTVLTAESRLDSLPCSTSVASDIDVTRLNSLPCSSGNSTASEPLPCSTVTLSGVEPLHDVLSTSTVTVSSLEHQSHSEITVPTAESNPCIPSHYTHTLQPQLDGPSRPSCDISAASTDHRHVVTEPEVDCFGCDIEPTDAAHGGNVECAASSCSVLPPATDNVSSDFTKLSQDSGFLSCGDQQLQPEQNGSRCIDELMQNEESCRPSDNSDRFECSNISLNSNKTLVTVDISTGVCDICMSAPKDASMIHGKSGHQACCFNCASKLKRSGKPCPVCRRPIQRVIKNYIV